MVIRRDSFFFYEGTAIEWLQVEWNLTGGAGGAAPAWCTLTFVALTGL